MDYVIEGDFEEIVARGNVKSPFLGWGHFKILLWKENSDQYNRKIITNHLTDRIMKIKWCDHSPVGVEGDFQSGK